MTIYFGPIGSLMTQMANAVCQLVTSIIKIFPF